MSLVMSEIRMPHVGLPTKREASNMSENNRVDPNASDQSQVEPQTLEPTSPDPDVQAPQNVLITEGYEPPATKTAEHKKA